MATAPMSNSAMTDQTFRPVVQNGVPDEVPSFGSDGVVAAIVVEVDDDVVEELVVEEVELVVDARWVVVVLLRCVVVVAGAAVVVGAGIVVEVETVDELVEDEELDEVGGSSALASLNPNAKIPRTITKAAAHNAAMADRRGVDGRITGATLDRRTHRIRPVERC